MKQKLELTWAGKDEPLKAEPRILLYDREKSHGAQDTGNLLIHGDNLLALKALEKKYAGRSSAFISIYSLRKRYNLIFPDEPHRGGSFLAKEARFSSREAHALI